jgi:hypothetical protein
MLLSKRQEDDNSGKNKDGGKGNAGKPHSKLVSAPFGTLVSDLLFGIGLGRTPIVAKALNSLLDVIGLMAILFCDFIIASFADNKIGFAIVYFDESRMTHSAGWNSSSQCAPLFL